MRSKRSLSVSVAYKKAPWKWTGRPKNDINTFWSRIDRRGPDECWNWRGCTNSTGYGSFRLGGRKFTAHRISYLEENGGITKLAPGDKKLKQFVLHKCDNRLCCNPAHLFLGSYEDNIQDAKQKGRMRGPRGEHHPNAKLTNKEAQEIREYLKQGSTRRQMREKYKVSERIIDRIARNEGYKIDGS